MLKHFFDKRTNLEKIEDFLNNQELQRKNENWKNFFNLLFELEDKHYITFVLNKIVLNNGWFAKNVCELFDERFFKFTSKENFLFKISYDFRVFFDLYKNILSNTEKLKIENIDWKIIYKHFLNKTNEDLFYNSSYNYYGLGKKIIEKIKIKNKIDEEEIKDVVLKEIYPILLFVSIILYKEGFFKKQELEDMLNGVFALEGKENLFVKINKLLKTNDMYVKQALNNILNHKIEFFIQEKDLFLNKNNSFIKIFSIIDRRKKTSLYLYY